MVTMSLWYCCNDEVLATMWLRSRCASIPRTCRYASFEQGQRITVRWGSWRVRHASTKKALLMRFYCALRFVKYWPNFDSKQWSVDASQRAVIWLAKVKTLFYRHTVKMRDERFNRCTGKIYRWTAKYYRCTAIFYRCTGKFSSPPVNIPVHR